MKKDILPINNSLLSTILTFTILSLLEQQMKNFVLHCNSQTFRKAFENEIVENGGAKQGLSDGRHRVHCTRSRYYFTRPYIFVQSFELGEATNSIQSPILLLIFFSESILCQWNNGKLECIRFLLSNEKLPEKKSNWTQKFCIEWSTMNIKSFWNSVFFAYECIRTEPYPLSWLSLAADHWSKFLEHQAVSQMHFAIRNGDKCIRVLTNTTNWLLCRQRQGGGATKRRMRMDCVQKNGCSSKQQRPCCVYCQQCLAIHNICTAHTDGMKKVDNIFPHTFVHKCTKCMAAIPTSATHRDSELLNSELKISF